MADTLRKELHDMIDKFPDEKLKEVYKLLQDDEYSDEMKAILDNEYQDYQNTKNAITKDDADKIINEILYKKD